MAISFRKNLKKIIFGSAARLWRKPKMNMAGIVGADPRRILIVRQHNQMGDMVCATPALRAIREKFPLAEIALVCAPVNRDVVRHNPHINRLYTFDKKKCTRPGPLREFIVRIRQFNPDLAVVLNSVSYSVSSVIIAAISGAQMIVGNDSKPFGFDISAHAYSLVMPSSPVQHEHAVLHNLIPLRAVEIDTNDLRTVVVPSEAEESRAAEIIQNFSEPGKPWIMHPGAGKTDNLWPAERFAEIAARVLRDGNRLLVLQGPADDQVMAVFRETMDIVADRDLLKRMLIVPPVTVGVCAALLATGDRYLGNDTGMMHVAGAVGVPTLILFGPTDPELWKPMAANFVHLRPGSKQLQDIDTNSVWAAWQDLPGSTQ